MTDLRDRPLHGVAVYNPDLLSKKELCEQFVARRPLLHRLLDDLGREGAGQHHLLVGQRGMGKTTLLRRLRYVIEDDEALSQRWLPLTFPEEQYNVARLSDLYLNCIDALGDALDRLGRDQDAKALDDAVLALPSQSEPERAKRALEILLGAADRVQRRLLLLIDSIDIILDRLKDDQWRIREALSVESRRLSLVGASSVMIESTYEYKAPFYEFFQIHELRGLNEGETLEVLRNLARLGNNRLVERVLDEDPARIRTLHALAGGNPRIAVLFYEVLARGTRGDVRSDLERLLDQCTPLYKARFEALSTQSQQIVDAVAIHWDPISAGELAEKVRVDTNVVSSQLNRLVQQGFVEKVSYHPSTKTGFQIAERFFNIWYLMRASRRVRQRLAWLVEFLRLLYGSEQPRMHAEWHLHATHGKDADSELRHAELSLMLAQVIDRAPRGDALESTAVRALMVDREIREKIADLVEPEGADASVKSLAERRKAAAEIQEAITSAKVKWRGWDPVRFGKLLGGFPSLSLVQKLEIATKLRKLPGKRVEELTVTLESAHARLLEALGDEGATEQIYEAFRKGYMADLRDTEGAAIAAEVLGAAALWDFLGELLCQSGRYVEAKTAHRKATELEPNKAYHWRRLGEILSDHLGRHEEALAAARRALELDAEDARSWLLVSRILCELRRYDEAADVFHKAGALGPLDAKARAWECLGVLFSFNLNRHEEAAAAYRKALEISPANVLAWIRLAIVLCDHLGRPEQAEQACRKAAEVDPNLYLGWLTLAWIRHGQTKIDQETESAARRAAALAPDNHVALYTLAAILVHQGNWPEAQEVARRFIGSGSREFPEVVWPLIVIFFREAVRAGHASDALKLLDDLNLAERWRPLREALAAIAAGSKLPLRRVAPEIRKPAEMLLAELLPEGLN